MTQPSPPTDPMQAEWRRLILEEIREVKRDVKAAPRADDLNALRQYVDEKFRRLEETVDRLETAAENVANEVHGMAKSVAVLNDRNLRASMIWGAVMGGLASIVGTVLVAGAGCRPSTVVLPSDEGSADEGSADEGSADEGSADEGSADEGSF